MLKSFEGNIKLFFTGLALLFLLSVGFALFNDKYVFIAFPFIALVALYFITDIELPFKLLLLSVPFSFNLERVFPVQMDFPDEALQLVVTFLFLFYLIKKSKVYDAQFFSHPLIVMVLLTFLWTAITTYTSIDIALSAKFLLKKIWYLVPFVFFAFGYFQEKKNIKVGFNLMFIVLFFLVLVVMYKAKGVGFSFEDVHDPIQPFFKNHVMYGSMISSFLFLIIGAFLNGRKGSVHKWIYALAIMIFMVAVYFSYSRGAWAAVVFGLGTMVLVRFKLMHWGILTFFTLTLSLGIWLTQDSTYLQYRPRFEKTVMHDGLKDHLMATIQGTDISSAERYYRWIASVRMSREHPIVGVGPNNFYSSYKAHSVTTFRTWVSRNLEQSTTHNYFLFMLVEQGIPGLILYAIFIFCIFYYGQRIYHKQQNRFDKNIVISILGMLGAIFINNFFSELLETDKIGSLFFIGVTLLVVYDLKTKKSIA